MAGNVNKTTSLCQELYWLQLSAVMQVSESIDAINATNGDLGRINQEKRPRHCPNHSGHKRLSPSPHERGA